MATDWIIWDEEIYKEIGYIYPKVKQKHCGNCKHSEVTNAGAYIPGLRCKIQDKMARKKDYGIAKSGMKKSHNSQVDGLYGYCNRWTLNSQ